MFAVVHSRGHQGLHLERHPVLFARTSSITMMMTMLAFLGCKKIKCGLKSTTYCNVIQIIAVALIFSDKLQQNYEEVNTQMFSHITIVQII